MKKVKELWSRSTAFFPRCLMAFMAVWIVSIASGMTAWAGTWKSDQNGWWYQNDDGSYPAGRWQWIDGNGDGIAECYYFDGAGYCLLSTITPDGCTVDGSGAWTVNGVVQTQAVSAGQTGRSLSDGAYAGASSAAAPADPPATSTASTVAAGISSTPYDGYTIIVNTNTKKYHVPGCKSVKAMKASNMGYCSDEGYLLSQGYSACKNCH